MSPSADSVVKRAIDSAVARGVETGVQVAAYLQGELVVDSWGGVADEVTGR
ncbi:MAG: beta-lactamase [Gammaproteobacteria bacterium]|nr:beta-lactamase [Gammaproteobacteria bacterium]